MTPAASNLTARPSHLAKPAHTDWGALSDDGPDRTEDNCPVICADEIFLGSTDSKRLRVVCYATSDSNRWHRRRVS